MKNKNYGIILAGGTGSRIGGDIPKQYLSLNGKEIIAWSMLAFEKNSYIDGIIVVAAQPYHELILDISHRYEISKFIKVVTGGNTRQQSSYQAVSSINFNDDDILLIHDAARPFISQEIINNSINSCKKHKAVATYVKTIDTITIIRDGMVVEIPKRDELYNTQTPQSFQYKLIKHAHSIGKNLNATDDVALLLKLKIPVYPIKGEYSNIKITTPEDYQRESIKYS